MSGGRTESKLDNYMVISHPEGVAVFLFHVSVTNSLECPKTKASGSSGQRTMKRKRDGRDSKSDGKERKGNVSGRKEEESPGEEVVPDIVLLRRRNIARNAAIMAALSFEKVPYDVQCYPGR